MGDILRRIKELGKKTMKIDSLVGEAKKIKREDTLIRKKV